MNGLMMNTPLTVPDVIFGRAERVFPGRPVIARTGDGLHHTTWGETARRARLLGSALQGLGVRPGDRVATFAWNSHRHLEAYLAVPSMGAVLHTLNLRLFAEQVAYIVEHADDSVVLVDQSLLDLWKKVIPKLKRARPVVVLPDLGTPVSESDGLDYEQLLSTASPMQWPALDEERAAAMCYTSGTTGEPKGVVYSHRSTTLHSFACLFSEGLGLTSRDLVLTVVPMFHANAWGLPYGAALTGAGLVLPGRDLSPPALCALIEGERPTVAAGVPTIWLGILEHWRREHPDLSSLRQTVCGGSAVPEALMRAFEDEIGVTILHAWGMTETSPVGTTARLPAGVADDAPWATRRPYVLSQGRPSPGVELRLVAEDGSEVPHDGHSLGELLVRGPWIARQYYGDAGGGDKFAGGWLHTGDVASIDELGYMRIADRTKDLVKSGGEWISSVELEGHLMAHPDVAEAAVIAVPHARWSERPLACVVVRPEARGRLTSEELIDHLRPLVAGWWLPDAIVFIDEVPKTSVGKFDKKALRAQFPEAPAEATVHAADAAAPATATSSAPTRGASS